MEKNVTVIHLGPDADLQSILSPLNLQREKIIQAAQECDLNTLKEYVNEQNVNTVYCGRNLLSHAFEKLAWKSDFDRSVPDYLLSKGAKIDKLAPFAHGSALLYTVGEAIYNSNFGPLEYLLEKNGNPFLDCQTPTGGTAANFAVSTRDLLAEQQKNRMLVLKRFCERAKNLHEAMETHDIATIEKFLKPELVNVPDNTGITPLIRVTSNCYPHLKQDTIEILKLLFKNQANANQIGILKDRKCLPLLCAIDYAIENNDTDIVQLFLANKANHLLNPDPENDLSETPAKRAIKYYTKKNECTCFTPEDDDKCLGCLDELKKEPAQKVLKLFNEHSARKKTDTKTQTL